MGVETGETTSSKDAVKDLLVTNISSMVIPNAPSEVLLFAYSNRGKAVCYVPGTLCYMLT
jgi:hypothetical protein